VRMGFDRPWYVQYFDFASRALQGDFGYSFIRHQPAYEVITERLPATIQLAAVAFFISLLAIPLGVLSATRANTPIDYVVTVVALYGQSIPGFWLGILLILLFGVHLRWLPISGSGSWQHLIMPGLTLAAFSIARNMRLTRSAMLDYMQRDFVRTARAKGIPERRVIYGHVLRNSLLPVITVIGIEFAFLMGGLVVTEQVFNLNGLGKLLVQSVTFNDYNMTQAIVMIIVLVFVLCNVLVDITYAWLDPRIRYS